MNSGNDHGRGYTWASICSTERRWRRRRGPAAPPGARDPACAGVVTVGHGGHGCPRSGCAGAVSSASRPSLPADAHVGPRRYRGVISSRGTDGPGGGQPPRAAAAPGWSSARPGQFDMPATVAESVGVAAGAVPDGEHLAAQLRPGRRPGRRVR